MASTAAIFDKQELRSQQDLLAVGQLLDDALAEFIKVRINAEEQSNDERASGCFGC